MKTIQHFLTIQYPFLSGFHAEKPWQEVAGRPSCLWLSMIAELAFGQKNIFYLSLN